MTVQVGLGYPAVHSDAPDALHAPREPFRCRCLLSDPLASSRLPDLPNAGYASRRQKETTDAIMHFMRNVERERALLLSIVVDGIDKWRRTAKKAWSGLLIDRDLLDSIFSYFVAQAGVNPAEQLLILHGMMQQQQRAVWDKRRSTQRIARENLQKALADLRHDRKRRTH